MKANFLILILLVCYIDSYSQPDTALGKRVSQLEASVANVQTTLNGINQKLNTQTTQTTVTTQSTPAQTTIQAKPQDKEPTELSTWQKLYVMMPVVLFLVIFFILMGWLKRDGFKLGDALLGDIPVLVKVPNPAKPTVVAEDNKGGAATATASPSPATVSISQTDPETEEPVLPKSSSRFIALFTGMAAIVIAISLLSYYVYFAIRGSSAPSFDKMFDAVLALGIGVVPYAVNKFMQSK